MPEPSNPRELSPPTPDPGVAIVTGAARGLGAEVARLLVRDGYRVLVNYLSSGKEAEALVEELGEDRAFAMAGDVSKESVAAGLVAKAETLGAVRVLVNNASWQRADAWNQPIEAIDPEDFRRVWEVDLLGSFLMSRAAVPAMRRAGSGSIVNLASASAMAGDAETLVYNAAKMGVVGFTRSLARALGPVIRVNAVAPGSTDTGWIEKWGLTEEERAALASASAVNRIGSPREVAEAIVFLASDRARFITGQTLVADGGVHMK